MKRSIKPQKIASDLGIDPEKIDFAKRLRILSIWQKPKLLKPHESGSKVRERPAE